MTDKLTPENRSKNMSAIKNKDTAPELRVRKFLFEQGFRYRLHKKDLPGKPDIYLKKYNTAIFINGCFWHRHKDCKFAYNPKSNIDFWQNKFQKNIENDRIKHALLSEAGINIIVVWECEIKSGIYKNWLLKLIRNNEKLLL